MMPNKRAASLHYDDVRIAVSTSPASHLDWLEEFLVPAFESGPCEPGDWSVEVTEDESRYEAIVGQGPCPDAAPVACFTLDHDFIRLPLWNSTGGARTVVDRPARVAYEVDQCRRHVTLVAPPNGVTVRAALMRVVRELAMQSVGRTGGVLLHAAALSVGDRGVIVAGPKDAGKTTLLIHLLRCGAAHYVSNDRVVVMSQAGSVPRMRGMPTIVSIRPGTLERFARLRQQLWERRFRYHRTLAEAAHTACEPPHPWSDGRFGLSPAQLCALLGVTPQGTARVAALVFPHIAHDEPGIHLRALTVRDATERVTRSIFGDGRVPGPDALFGAGKDAAGEDTAVGTAHTAQLAAVVPAFECRLGPNAYDNARDAAAVAERLVA